MRVRWIGISIFFFFMSLTNLQAQLKFSASASPAQIGPGEYTQIKFSVENAKEVENIQPPSFDNFKILSGPNQESGMTMVNGDVKKYVAITYVIRPVSTGSFTISPATATADGHELKSNSVSIKVDKAYANSGSSSGGGNSFTSPFNFPDPFADAEPRTRFNDNVLRKGESPQEKIKNNIIVRLETDKTSCYVGEPIVASYKLYTRLRSESNITKNPSFSGFSVIDLQQPDNLSSHIEKLNGREYNVYTIRKVQLYPLQSGNLELEKAEVENNVQFIKAEYLNKQQDMFGDLFGDNTANIPSEGIEVQKVTLQSKPLSILVKPLPDPKPSTFKGAVGNFEVSASMPKYNFTTDDAGSLTVIINGTGNMQMVTAPDISWPNEIEGFEPKTTDDIYKTTVPVSGRKIIEYPFTISAAGQYTLPPVNFSFFDPRSGVYKTIYTKPINFTVTQGSGKPKTIDTSAYKKNEPNMLTKFFSNRLRVVSVVAVLIILGLIIWLKRDKKRDEQERALQELALKEAEPIEAIIENQTNPLMDAEEALFAGDGNLFYAKLNNSFKHYLSHKFDIPVEYLNKKSINEKMDQRSIPLSTSLQVNSLMDEIEWQLFTPSVDAEKMQEMYERANMLVQEINNKLLIKPS